MGLTIKAVQMMLFVAIAHSIINNAVSLTVEEDSLQDLDSLQELDSFLDHQTNDQDLCKDVYSGATCRQYSELCQVDKIMKTNCMRTCKICTPKPIVPSTCKNAWSDVRCTKFEQLCDHNRMVQKSCKRTCGYCAAVTEIPCIAKKYGCCWDNITEALGNNGEGCYPCKDMRSNCPKLVNYCSQYAAVRRQCPETCRLPCATCKDSAKVYAHCPSYKRLGYCERHKKVMKTYCAKTCQLCS